MASHLVGHVLKLGFLVVVGQDDGVALPLELEDGLLEIVGQLVFNSSGRGGISHATQSSARSAESRVELPRCRAPIASSERHFRGSGKDVPTTAQGK